ncbi:MAG TPA: sensory rhodopsin transducer [Ohtaekwangia sp.]|nr:sensory rhodopsin transducer [Ohtaekwangia sp.]
MKNKQQQGKRIWAFAAGHIPLHSTGTEPAFTSHDKVAILNTGDKDAQVALVVFYADGDPVGDYTVTVKRKRIRKIRFNDLIDPLPIPLDTPFGFLIVSDVDIIVQFSRLNTGASALSSFCVTAFPNSQ